MFQKSRDKEGQSDVTWEKYINEMTNVIRDTYLGMFLSEFSTSFWKFQILNFIVRWKTKAKATILCRICPREGTNGSETLS